MKGETTEPPPSSALRALSSPAALVRRHDRERYLTALLAPAERRDALFALYAFNYEVARVRETVTEPMLGQIRLQWWREVVDAAYAGAAARRHEVALPLTAAIREFRLSRQPFDLLIDARERDLNDDPPAHMADLEAYAEASSAGLVRLALEILGLRDAPAGAAARDIGIAYALAGLIRAMPFHARTGRSYIPADLARRTGLDPADYAALRVTPALRQAVAALADAACAHLAAARRQHPQVARSALPALLPAVAAGRWLARIRRAQYNPFDPVLARADALLGWRLLAAMALARF